MQEQDEHTTGAKNREKALQSLESIYEMNLHRLQETKDDGSDVDSYSSQDPIKVITNISFKGGAHAPVPSMALTNAELKAEIKELIGKFDEYILEQEARKHKERPRRVAPLTSSFYVHNEFSGRWKQQKANKAADTTDMATLGHAVGASTAISNYFSYGALCHCLSYMLGSSSLLPPSGTMLASVSQKGRPFFTPQDRKRALESILFSWSKMTPAQQQSSERGLLVMPEVSQVSVTSELSSSSLSFTSHDEQQPSTTVVSSIPTPAMLPNASADATNDDNNDNNNCPLCKLQFRITRERPQFHCPHCEQRFHADCVVQVLEHQSHQKCPCCHEQMISSQMMLQMVEKVRAVETDTTAVNLVETIELNENEKIEELYEDDEAPPGYEWEEQEIELVVPTTVQSTEKVEQDADPSSLQSTSKSSIHAMPGESRTQAKVPEVAFV